MTNKCVSPENSFSGDTLLSRGEQENPVVVVHPLVCSDYKYRTRLDVLSRMRFALRSFSRLNLMMWVCVRY